jgi:phosphoglycolate phosphatase-like HAD superfamily hydrolase
MLFDLDGTLFKAETVMLPAYYKVFDRLREEGLHEGATPPEERLLGSLGLLLEHIWRNVIPDSPVEVRERANDLLLEYQLVVLQDGVGELYGGVKETLTQLKERGMRLFVASNGMEGYVKGVVQAMGIAPLFDALYSAGEYQTRSKVDLVKLLMTTHGVETAWMVGDRSSDVEAGKKNGLFVIGCDYADFSKSGELDGADVTIRDFERILDHLQ